MWLGIFAAWQVSSNNSQNFFASILACLKRATPSLANFGATVSLFGLQQLTMMTLHCVTIGSAVLGSRTLAFPAVRYPSCMTMSLSFTVGLWSLAGNGSFELFWCRRKWCGNQGDDLPGSTDKLMISCFRSTCLLRFLALKFFTYMSADVSRLDDQQSIITYPTTTRY